MNIKLLAELEWKQQTAKECREWAKLTTTDDKRLDDFEAGVRRGWDECIRVLKLHGLVLRD